MERSIRVIISGGGTGGHIFPALSIADKLKELNPDNEILFVGAEGKMEMEKVPAAGYKIEGLPIVGLQRRLALKNLSIPFKILASLRKARRIVRDFKPDAAVGVGGYASAPLLWAATGMKIPSLIQEQNSFAGLTNRRLGSRVQCICVAYEGMEKFFPADRLVLSGNPIRKDLASPATPRMKAEALQHYHLDPSKKHIFLVGGSLGSGTMNRAMRRWIEEGCPGGEGVEVLWQCGKYYKAGVDAFMSGRKVPQIQYFDFVQRMDLAYAAADVVVSRAGASTVSELCALHKAVIFVPSPNVAEDHQTRNALALVRKDAARMVRDAEAVETLLPSALQLADDPGQCAALEKNIAALSLPEAALTIAEEVYKIIV